jgi:hypothetical protein
MRAESLDDVQARVFREVLGFEELPSVATVFAAAQGEEASTPSASAFVDHQLLSPLAKKVRTTRPQEDVALGTVPADNERDLKLAVLVQSRALLGSEEIERISEIAAGEVEIIYIGRQQLYWQRTRQRPLVMGSSTSPANAGYSGTLGFFARNEQGKVVMVSNNHVLANVNSFPKGTRIVQQADGDGGRSPQDEVATLDNYIPIQFGGVPNAVDAATAVLDEVAFDAKNVYGNTPPPTTLGRFNKAGGGAPVLPTLPVQKTGRTTGHTLGVVRAINVNNYVVNMGVSGKARFDGQMTFEVPSGVSRPFSRPGDSGSLILDMELRPVALLFAGSSSGGNGNLGITAGNPISSVLSQLGVSFA